jgi:CRP-like cAMP-binding protein
MAGLSRETVSRLLARFHRDGQLLHVLNRMTLNHPQKLETLYR